MKDLVSVIVTTKNEEKNIKACLQSIKDQSYKHIEMIVVDNNSTDKTKEIAAQFTKNVFDIGPERSAQRNYGAKKAKGDYLLFIDADMILTRDVVKSCVIEIKNSQCGGIIIPEESFGVGIWARAKALERSFYVGNDYIEAARFYTKESFIEMEGFNEVMISGEDWDLSQKVKQSSGLCRITSKIRHNEGQLRLFALLKKKFYYGKNFSKYLQNNHSLVVDNQISIVARYKLFFSKPSRLLEEPITGISMLFMKFLEYCAGFAGFVVTKI